LIAEVKEKQPKVYRLWQDCPELICPPEGETLAAARGRVQKSLKKLLKKHKRGVIALVVPEPLASIVCSSLKNTSLGDLWKSQLESGSWETVELESPQQIVV
jgi:broad specificity phosphatase PhoE